MTDHIRNENTYTTDGNSVIITRKEYNDLISDRKLLQALQAGGVDNWDGYDFCFEDE